MSATNENLIYTASTQIYKSVDNGNQWIDLSNTNESQILTIEISTINDQHILLSTGPNTNEHVELLESFDGGKTLRNITSNLPNKYITKSPSTQKMNTLFILVLLDLVIIMFTKA